MADIWSSPIYKLRVPDPKDKTHTKLIEIVLDVTLSAPSFTEPSGPMKVVLKAVIDKYLPPKGKILDFGAGKLRNALYLLKRGLSVCGVEFEKLSATESGKKAYSKASGYSKFWQLVYPEAFFSNTAKFDFVLLVNVLSIMPIPSERFLVIQESHKKLREGGYLLWYSQYGDADYKRRCTEDVRFGDGYFIGSNRRYKTFYREFSLAEMDSIMLANGFSLVCTYPVPHNHVRLYRKSPVNPFGTALTRTSLRRGLPRDSSIQNPVGKTPKAVERSKATTEVRPDPHELSLEANYASRLSKLPPGRKHATEYQTLVEGILTHLFPRSLGKSEKEFPIQDGTKRIDILFRTGKEGFFSTLNSEYGVESPYVIVECKNYSDDLENPEIDQLANRLGTGISKFGMVVCRRIDNPAGIIKKCKAARASDPKKIILVLEDADLKELLDARKNDEWKRMDDYLDKKLLAVLA